MAEIHTRLPYAPLDVLKRSKRKVNSSGDGPSGTTKTPEMKNKKKKKKKKKKKELTLRTIVESEVSEEDDIPLSRKKSC